MIELIVSDMDGTLLNNKMAVSEANQEAIKTAEKLGIKFMVATGRGYTEAVPALDEVGIRCPMITVNGGQTYDEHGTLLESVGIDQTRIRHILNFAHEKGLYAELVMADGVYSDNKVKRIETMTSLLQVTNPDTTFKMAVAMAQRDTAIYLPITSSKLVIGNVNKVSNVPLSFSPAIESIAG